MQILSIAMPYAPGLAIVSLYPKRSPREQLFVGARHGRRCNRDELRC
ncbi:hypothetical protein QA641_12285 [Bradyrhizobium sp. CB1650]|nr:hypothetical protein [Bradyrhizobium sp. CB1650]WGD54619.1 hypothetical protein QA641_12285 [Bradyrhizobium sp. CB1650]